MSEPKLTKFALGNVFRYGDRDGRNINASFLLIFSLMDGMNINIKIEYFLYIYCLPSETLTQSRASLLTASLSNLYCKVDKFYDHL